MAARPPAEKAPAKPARNLSFQPYGGDTMWSRIIGSLVAGFQDIEPNMNQDLATLLVESLKKAWNTTLVCSCPSKEKLASQWHYKRLCGLDGNGRDLYYPSWFFLAAWLGPGHPYLKRIRKEMSELWGVEFPTDAIIYPKGLPAETQKTLFYGNSMTAKRENTIEGRAQDIKRTINNSSIEDLAATITGLPNMLNNTGSATDSGEVGSLKRQLADTRNELKETRDQVDSMKKEIAGLKTTRNQVDSLITELKDLKNSRDQFSTLKQELNDLQISTNRQLQDLREDITNTKAKLSAVGELARQTKNEEEVLSDRVGGLGDRLTTTDKQVEKTVETCALVLSILSAPGGHKRKLD
ncbi:hypothetical protein ACHAPJ_009946 [Fusarium lateritium]